MSRKANMSGANLYWARIKGAIMENANLKGANMEWCNLSGTDFSACDLSKANVQWSLTFEAKFSSGQFFRISPDVLSTLNFAGAGGYGNGSANGKKDADAKRTFSFSPQNQYISISPPANEYGSAGKTNGVYRASANSDGDIHGIFRGISIYNALENSEKAGANKAYADKRNAHYE